MERNLEAMLDAIEQRTSTPFAWGSDGNDCVSFAAAIVKAQTGVNRLGDLRWSSESAARRLLKRLGGLEKAMDARLRRIAPAEAMRGDIAGVEDAELGLRLMIVEGPTLVGPSTKGLRRLPRAAMSAAWSAVEPSEIANV
jgi:hypothetical protein